MSIAKKNFSFYLSFYRKKFLFLKAAINCLLVNLLIKISNPLPQKAYLKRVFEYLIYIKICYLTAQHLNYKVHNKFGKFLYLSQDTVFKKVNKILNFIYG